MAPRAERNPSWKGGLENFIPEPNSGCWLWLGYTRNGYARAKIGSKLVSVHRVLYEREIGPVPAGLTLDHKCRVRSCINPAHLEPVSNAENVRRGMSPSAIGRRKTTCPKGHQFSFENTYINPGSGDRFCRTCLKAYFRNYHLAKSQRCQAGTQS